MSFVYLDLYEQHEQQNEFEKSIFEDEIDRFRALLKKGMVELQKQTSIQKWHELVLECASLNRLEFLQLLLEFLATFQVLFQNDHDSWYFLIVKCATHEARQIIFAHYSTLLFLSSSSSSSQYKIRKRPCDLDCKTLEMDVELADRALVQLHDIFVKYEEFMTDYTRFTNEKTQKKEPIAFSAFAERTRQLFDLRKEWIRNFVPL